MHTILGAGGVIANSLARELMQQHKKVRLVSRKPKQINAAEIIAADATVYKDILSAVLGSEIVYLCVGLKYDFAVWKELWPKIMTNTIDACKQAQAKLVFFDNVYMYGKVSGPMTEQTPYNPCTRKGELRAKIATQLMDETKKGNIAASIARAADFYGPNANSTSVPNMLVFANLANGKRAQWLANDSVKHSFTYTADAAKALSLLSDNENSWNQVWHMPTAPGPLTGKEFVALAAKEFGAGASCTVLKKWMIKLGGIFDTTIKESYEMLYQSEYEYIFDSTKFIKAFDYTPLSYIDGIIATAKTYTKK